METRTLIFGEVDGEIDDKIYGLCTIANCLSPTGDLYLVVKSNVKIDFDKLKEFNVEKCFFIQAESEKYYDIPRLLEDIYLKIKPQFIFANSDTLSNQYLSYLAGLLNKSIITNCADIDTKNQAGSLIIHKDIFGNKIRSEIRFSKSYCPIILTFKSNLFKITKSAPKNTFVEYIDENQYRNTRIKLIETKKYQSNQIPLEEAEIVVSIGRGIKATKDIQMAEDLANKLNGSLGASRAIVDQGFLKEKHQIGQTGKSVNPKIYLALGISGAPQHLAGMINSKKIIAVNKDPDAAIFKYADVGVVGDIYEIIPKLNELL